MNDKVSSDKPTELGTTVGRAFQRLRGRYAGYTRARLAQFARRLKREIYPERAIFVQTSKKPALEEKSVTQPLDDGSFLYFLRTLPLTVGQTYSFDRYFRPDRNPVRITVVRKERITVPAGTFDAIVLRPTIKTKGIFSEDGHAEIWLSDDDRRIMLQLKSKLSFGSLNLYLKSYFPSPNP